MTSLSRELVFLILQFLDEEKFKDTVHKLEQESGFFFSMRHFEELVVSGEWEEVEKYLSGFTKLDDNRYSMKIFFEIRKQKYLEALDSKDKAKAVDILVKDLKVFSTFNDDLFKEITQLLTLNNFRENEQLSKYGDTKTARTMMLTELRKLIEANPLFREKLQFPNLKQARLRTLINQSLNWQHQLCKNPRPNPDIKTLFYDHTCSSQPNGARAPSPAPAMMNVMQKPGGFPQLGPHGPFQPAGAQPLPTSIASWMTNMPPHPAVSGGPLGGLAATPNTAAVLKRPASPASMNPAFDYHSADSEHVLKRARAIGVSQEIGFPTSQFPISYPNVSRSQHALDEVPKTVAMTLNQGSSVTSMDFHPAHQTVLLVGTSTGDISIWELAARDKIAHRSFKLWETQARSTSLQAALSKEPPVSVNRVVWNSDGSQLGVAYSKHLVHLYNYSGHGDLVNHLEIEAHNGGVNDVAFSQPNERQCVVTCGDDKTIKVWDAMTGIPCYAFEGHEASVYSVRPHSKENIQFIFSTSVDGKIKAWLYEQNGSKIDYTAPGNWCTTMAYSADGTRLFSCGTSKDGTSTLVEWNESEGTIKRTYEGLRKQTIGVVQFDTTKNRFLVAGEEFMIKFWDMDNPNVLTTTDAEGGLMPLPRVRFNKNGSLLAVSANNSCIKILANADGQLLLSLENRSCLAGKVASDSMSKAMTLSPLGPAHPVAGTSVAVVERGVPVTAIIGMNSDGKSLGDVKPKIHDEAFEKSKIWKLIEINEPSQCRSLRLPDNLLLSKATVEEVLPPQHKLIRSRRHNVSARSVVRLIYTNSGLSILALTSSAVHKLWKWQKSDRASAKATASIAPQLWQPPNSTLMTNEVAEGNKEEAVHCFALSKNDSYIMSASGGKISLFNMMTFKTMTTFMASPPAATFLAFHPRDNNIVAIGMEDCTIQIYNVRIDEVKIKLKGHQKRITGLAFSNMLNILVSSGADALLYSWGLDGWEKKASSFLPVPSAGRVTLPHSEMKVQFHHDQIHMLVVHETQLAIYDAAKLECLKQWILRDGLITHATYSCDSQMVYSCLVDGTVNIFTANLRLRCRINPSTYLNAQPSLPTYPLVIAAHPSEPNQFALGLTDGGVQVFEPLESEGKWGTSPPPENVGPIASSSQNIGNATQEQSSR